MGYNLFMTDKQIMKQLLDYAREKMEQKNAYPFAAFVVRSGVVISRSYNRFNDSRDPTTHGEMEAMSAVNRSIEHKQFVVLPDGYELFSTCEPCLACFDAALWANVKKFVFSVDHHDFPDYFHSHSYNIENYEKDNPGEIKVVRSVLHDDGVKLFSEAKQKYGW